MQGRKFYLVSLKKRCQSKIIDVINNPQTASGVNNQRNDCEKDAERKRGSSIGEVSPQSPSV